MVSPQVMLIAAAIALCLYVGEEVAIGLKKLAVLEKKGIAKIAHVLKKIPHPHHDDGDESK
jgi:hypothetical protein